jgi:hypothetical protein
MEAGRHTGFFRIQQRSHDSLYSSDMVRYRNEFEIYVRGGGNRTINIWMLD